MSSLPVADPRSLGFDPTRLARIDSHLARYVDDGRLPGWQVLVTRRGEVVHHSVHGLRDREAGLPVTEDTVWRIYSMTKPVTSVVAMMLWEEGAFALTDEVSRWIPSFADVRVFDKGTPARYFTVPAVEPIRVWHLLTHTAGLTYGFLNCSSVDALYRAAGHELTAAPDLDLAQACDAFAGLPLLFQPGTAWGYSVATDVLGRLVEVVCGKPLAEVVAERVTGPLGMVDTAFHHAGDRLAALYAATPQGVLRHDAMGQEAQTPPRLHSGGGGLVSTAADYHRFTQLLLRGGELDGTRLLAPRTVAMMTSNHLPGDQDLGALSTGGFAETVFDGLGFGLGFATVLDPRPSKSASSVGEFYWGGLASTAFWVDPALEVTAHFYTQLVPSSTYPIRAELRQLVNSAVVA